MGTHADTKEREEICLLDKLAVFRRVTCKSAAIERTGPAIQLLAANQLDSAGPPEGFARHFKATSGSRSITLPARAPAEWVARARLETNLINILSSFESGPLPANNDNAGAQVGRYSGAPRENRLDRADGRR